MKRIKFKIEGEYKCLTSCPYSKKVYGNKDVKVYSINCCICKYYIKRKTNREDGFIVCNADEIYGEIE
jgi:hypothetical protein